MPDRPRTRPFIPRVSLLFDFDQTLATHSLDAIPAVWGLSQEEWRERFERPLGARWDEILRHGRALLDAGHAMGRPVSDALLREAAGNVELYPGVLDMPERLRAVAREILPEIEVEFVVLSSGFATLIEASGVMDAFDRLYASTYHFAEDGPDGEHGEALCMKRAVTHAGKALYLEAHAKNLDVDGANGPENAGRPVPDEDFHVPFEQLIYCGDGESDLQTFAFIERVGGIAVAVDGGDGGFDPDGLTREQRVENVVPPDYSPGGATLEKLAHAVRIGASRAALRKGGDT